MSQASSRLATDSDHRLHEQLGAYNRAFDELGLRFRWDAHTLASLAAIDSDEARVATYIETHHPHLLNAYSRDFLCAAILERKNARTPSPLNADRGAMPANGRTLVDTAAGLLRGERSEAGLPVLSGA